MEKERRIKTLSLVALIVAVLGLTVAFAALSQTLTIKGGNAIGMFDMNIVFAADANGGLYGTEGVYEGKEYGYNNSISTITVSEDKRTLTFDTKFKLPGDYTVAEAMFGNNGGIDAVVSEIEYGTPVCVSDIGKTEDEELVCKNLIYDVKYTKGSEETKSLNVGEELNAGELAAIIFKVTLNEELDKVLSSNVTISNLSLKINYTQK